MVHDLTFARIVAMRHRPRITVTDAVIVVFTLAALACARIPADVDAQYTVLPLLFLAPAVGLFLLVAALLRRTRTGLPKWSFDAVKLSAAAWFGAVGFFWVRGDYAGATSCGLVAGCLVGLSLFIGCFARCAALPQEPKSK